MPKGNSGIKNQPKIRGVLQSEIDKKRGTRDHLGPHELTWKTIQDDYERVGINITDEEAGFISKAIHDFSFKHDTDMRKAKSKEQKGIALNASEKQYLSQYNAIEEYCKVAPVYSGKTETLYRGIKISTITPEYAKNLMSKKVGDTWNVDGMPTSFSTEKHVSENFSYMAGKKGILVHMPMSKVKNSISISGASQFWGEQEVMVANYNWKIGKIDNQLDNNGYYNIYLK